MFYPGRAVGKIRGIQVHNIDVEEAEAGHRTAINLSGLDKETIHRGNMAATVDCLQPSYLLDGHFLYLESNKKQLKNRTRVRIHIGTAEIMGRIVLLEDEELEPGSKANVQLLLEEQVGSWPGDRFVVRNYSPVYTIGGGVIFNSSPRKRRRFKAVNKDIFQVYRDNMPEDLVQLCLKESGYNGLTFDKLAVKMGVFGKKLKKILQTPLSARKILVIETEKQRMIDSGIFENLAKKAITELTSFHTQNPLKAGLSKEELRTRLYRGLDQRLFQFLLHDLLKRQKIMQDQAVIRLAGHQVSLKEGEESLRQELTAFYQKAGLAPPTIKEVQAAFAKDPQSLVKEVMALMTADNTLVKVTEDLYFHAPPLENLQNQLKEFLQKEEEIDTPAFKTMTGLSRKFSIPLLEYFDKIKVTIRVGDKRILREKKNK
jgi:selenocysteine-specific elongation factor